MRTYKVRLRDRSYPICVGGSLSAFNPRLWGDHFSKKVLVVSDSKVSRHYAKPCLAALKRAGFDPVLCVIPAGEKHKTLDTAQKVFSTAFRHGIERRSLIVALGGGVVGDLAGFVAATALRGVPLVQVPTTLLAQVDASIGGKVAVDAPEGKNLIGAFYQPVAVWMDVGTLRTLPIKELRNGMAEVIKYGLIADQALFKILECSVKTFGHWPVGFLEDLVFRCAKIKAQVVEQDERETSGIRQALNLGHTLGHAIEAATAYKTYTHGQAVALGLCAAGFMGEKLQGFKERKRMKALITAYGLPTHIFDTISRRDILQALSRDKKVRDGLVRFVLPKAIGRVVTDVTVSMGMLKSAMEEIEL